MGRTSKPHVLSDGTTIRIKTRRTIAGTFYDEIPSRKRNRVTFMRLANHMFIVVNGKDLFRITNPNYEYAGTDADGAAAALRFCVDSAESVIEHARQEGISVQDCYGPIQQ